MSHPEQLNDNNITFMYNDMIKIIGGLLLTIFCFLFTYFFMMYISKGAQFVSIVTGSIFGFVLSGVFQIFCGPLSIIWI